MSDTPPSLTLAEIERGEELLRHISGGEWVVSKAKIEGHPQKTVYVETIDGTQICDLYIHQGSHLEPFTNDRANAAFIAYIANHARALLASAREVERLREAQAATPVEPWNDESIAEALAEFEAAEPCQSPYHSTPAGKAARIIQGLKAERDEAVKALHKQFATDREMAVRMHKKLASAERERDEAMAALEMIADKVPEIAKAVIATIKEPKP